MNLSRADTTVPITSGGPVVLNGHGAKKKLEGTVIPELLTNARTALELTVKLAPLIPVPFVTCIFESAQVIVNTASQMRENKLQSAELAEYAAQLTHEVHRTVHGREKLIDDDLKTALQQLQARLDETRDFMDTQANLNTVQRIVKRGTVTEKLIACKANLQYAMSTFTTTSSIWTRMMLQGIVNRLDEERRYDKKHRYRIYREGEVYRLRRYTQMNVQQTSIVQAGASIEYYDAEVEGRLRIVKRYHDFDTFQRALDVLDLLSKCPSVNVAQLEGYSLMNSVLPFLVLKGDLRPFHQYVMLLADTPRYLVSLRAMGSIVDTTIFLRKHRLIWTNEVSKLMLNSHEEVVLGVNDDIRMSERPLEAARIPILTDWGTRGNGTTSYRRSKPLSLDKIRSEQPSINALQLALTHPDPCRWAINDVGSLWRQYVTEWGSVLSSSTKTVRIAKVNPSIGFGYLLQDEHGHPQLVNLCPVDASDQFLRSRSYHTTAEGWAVPSNYSLFHNSSFLTNVRQVRATVRRDVAHTTAWDYMLRFGCANATLHGIELKDLIFVYQVAQRLSAFLDSEDPTDKYFHVRPTNSDGFLQEPWGYFSTERIVSQDSETIPVECLGVDQASGKLSFSNNPSGVSAVIKHYYKISYIQLHPRDAALVEWIHDRFSKSTAPMA